MGSALANPRPACGGRAPHVPVLLGEVCQALEAGRGGCFVDGTFGAGGYAGAILQANPGNRVLGIDRDPEAIAAGRPMAEAFPNRLTLAQGRFGDLETLVREAWGGDARADGIVLDIGVSSMQIDQAGRGFSFRQDGPLDMRMSQAGRSAADIVNEADEAELADIFHFYGEERRARAVARGIVEARRRSALTTTAQLADLVGRYVKPEPGGIHPATRVFQGLRIAVNDELGELVRALHGAERVLKAGGRLAVVTFHSLEDRIVKAFLGQRAGRTGGLSRHLPAVDPPPPTFKLVTRGPILPGEAEVAANPRARSAKLRAAERTEAPPQDEAAEVVSLAGLPRAGEGRARR